VSASAPSTRGPHFFCEPDAVDAASATLHGDEAHHLATVLRAGRGDPVSLAHGTGRLYQARVTDVRPGRVRCAVENRFDVAPPDPLLTVVHALPKGRKLDDVVQRLSEVGVDRIVPVHSTRSQVTLRGEKATLAVDRWRSVALAAAKQARRVRVLDVAPVGEWGAVFAGAPGVVLWEEAEEGLPAVLAGLAPTSELVLAVGPEGGLTAQEVAATGLPAARLGPTILRTETAALVAASVVLSAVGRFG
jgi:16S rRNA (uracil1498-N3)-methyltransferase